MSFNNKYSYTKSINTVNVEQLSDEVYATISKKVMKNYPSEVVDGTVIFNENGLGNNLNFYFENSLSNEEVVLLTQAVNNHIADFNYVSPNSSPEVYNNVNITTLSAITFNYSNPFPHGEIYMSNNSTPTTIKSTVRYYRVSGTTLSGSLRGFSNPISNRIKYTGNTSIKVHVTCNFCASSSNNQTVRSAIVKNGTGSTLINGILINTEQIMTLQPSGAFKQLYSGGIVTLEPDDYLELYIRNSTANNNVVVNSMSFIVKQV